MRFGVKDENTLDHMTWVACKEAIQQCYEGSDGLFFLSLQADRYGYLPLPKYLDEAVLSQARKDHENDSNFTEITKFLDEWYKLDANHCPPRYELKALSSLNDPDYWRIVLPTVRDTVLSSVPFETLKVLPEEIVVNRSVTQWETFYGLDCDKERCYWIQRVFGKASLRAFKDNSDCWKITDIFSDESNAETTDENSLSAKNVEGRSTAKKLEVLHAKMKMYLRENQRIELPTHCSPEAYLRGEGCEEYLEEWERVTRDCLEKELKKVIEKSEQWNDGFAGIPADQLEEIVHHCSIAFAKASNFFGREDLLGKALEMAKQSPGPIKRGGNAESKLLSGICMAIVGKSGCGKTALMSKLALSLGSGDATAVKEIPVIIRFCGTSRYSLNGLKLIQSICLQVLAAYDKREELEELIGVLPSQYYTTAVEYFQNLVSQYPIYLLIDNLDQLENRYEERSKLTFLHDLKPHEQSRIIVSTLPDEYEENGKPGKYFYQCERTLKNGSVPILDVGIMNEIEATIKSLLSARQKNLTNSDQWNVTLQAVSHEPTILYINLAMEVISQWRSFDKEVILRPTVKGLIHQIFGDLEVSYGKEFTSISFAMITFSREGINDPELKDLLSLHEGVMTEVCQYSKLHCFPMHMWLRLKQAIKNLVTEKENHCIKWYHRQLWETASERYSKQEKECHEIMGKYFANLVDVDVKKEKDIMSQPLILNEVSVWMPESLVNRRRVVEGYFHLIKRGLLQEAVEEVCSLEFVCCSALAGDLLNCVRSVGELVRLFGDNDDLPHRLDHYYRWMRKKATTIVVDPRRQARMTAGEEPLISIVKQQITQLEEKERSDLGLTLEPMTFGCAEDFDALEMELVGHTESVSVVSWNHDDSKILSGSHDYYIKIWDGMTGELLNTLLGHSEQVNAVSWNHDSSKIVSGSKDSTIIVWDGITCELLTSFFDNVLNVEVRSLSWNHDSSKIASGSNDEKVKIWDATTFELLWSLSGQWAVRSVSWSHDDSKLLSSSSDGTIKIWNPVTGELLTKVECDFYGVSSAVWNHDSSAIVSGAKTIKVWDGLTGDLLKTLEGHTGEVHSVMWNHDGSKILSGSEDGTIKIWNAVTGEQEETVVETNNMSVAWNHDGSRIVSGSPEDGIVRVWKRWGKQTRKKLSSRIRSLSNWNPVDSNRILSGYEDGTIQIWDGEKRKLLDSWEGHSDEVTSIFWNHDGTRIASGSKDKTIKIWDGVNYELLMTLEGHFEQVILVAWNHDSSRIVSVEQQNEETTSIFFLWEANTGEKLADSLDFPMVYVGSTKTISWNQDDTELLVGYSKTVRIHHGEYLAELSTDSYEKKFKDCRYPCSWNHDSSKIVSGSFSENLIICDVESGEEVNSLSGHLNMVSLVIWNHADNRIFSAAYDGTIRIWDGTSGQLLKTETVGGHVIAMSVTRAGDRIAFIRESDPFIRCLSVTIQ
jgi:WD40 repeat protein